MCIIPKDIRMTTLKEQMLSSFNVLITKTTTILRNFKSFKQLFRGVYTCTCYKVDFFSFRRCEKFQTFSSDLFLL